MTASLRIGCVALAASMGCATAEVRPAPAQAPTGKQPLSVYVSPFKDRTSSLTADAVAGASVTADAQPSSDGAELEKTLPEEIGAYFTLSSRFTPAADATHCDVLLVGVIQDALNGHLKLGVRLVSCATKAVLATTIAELPYEWRRGMQRPVSDKLNSVLDELAAQLPAK